MTEHRDPVVADALRRLDVPDHEPGFWDQLDARLAAGDRPEQLQTPSAHDEQETTVVDLDSTRSARRRTPALTLAAAVAIIVALVAGVALLGDEGDDESQLDVAETTDTTVPEDTATTEPNEEETTTTAAPETTTTVVGDQDAVADETAIAWLDGLAAGDVDAAYDLLDERSKADLSRAEFGELSSGLFEGAAAFAGAGIDRTVRDADGFTVVTFSGDVEREGMVETAAYPVVVTASGVHFTFDGPQVELDPEYAQGSGTTLASPLELVVQEETDAWIWIDGEDAEPLAGRGPVSVDVEAAAGAGTHLVSVVATEGERITARSYTVVVP